MPGIDAAKVQTELQVHQVDLTALASWISLFLHFETISLYEYLPLFATLTRMFL